jgi:hypothetical protein
VIEAQPLPQPVPIPHTAITVSPLDLPAEQFKAGLDRRKANRELLMEWLRSALVEGVDFGRIHVASKERCQFARQGRVKDCGDPHHWSKPSLFKPGAEKITGMLGMTVHYPSLPDYEQAVLNGIALTTVMLRCELVMLTVALLPKGWRSQRRPGLRRHQQNAEDGREERPHRRHFAIGGPLRDVTLRTLRIVLL